MVTYHPVSAVSVNLFNFFIHFRFRFHPCADPAWDADVQPRQLHRAAGAPRAVARGAGRGHRRRDLPGVRRLRGPLSRGRECERCPIQ